MSKSLATGLALGNGNAAAAKRNTDGFGTGVAALGKFMVRLTHKNVASNVALEHLSTLCSEGPRAANDPMTSTKTVNSLGKHPADQGP